MSPLSGKIVLVTGARTGLGAATAQALAELGATVIAAGRRVGDCAGMGEAVHDFPIDVADLTAIPGRIEALLARFGSLDILVNNAATIAPMAPIGAFDPLAFDAAMRLNVSGPLALTTALWPHLRSGRVINIVSGAANTPLQGWAAYCASKAALLMLTRSIDLEGTARGTKAFAFAPGLVDTAMQEEIRAAKINAISDIARETLLPATTPARFIAWIATGAFDDLAGTYLDIRNTDLATRMDRLTAPSSS
jgi:NAD(P)-dependent dehydrogenase (short-subunit alcohol dehydrogenase family)